MRYLKNIWFLVFSYCCRKVGSETANLQFLLSNSTAPWGSKSPKCHNHLQIGMQTTLSYFSLTKIVEFTPFNLINNHTEVIIRMFIHSFWCNQASFFPNSTHKCHGGCIFDLSVNVPFSRCSTQYRCQTRRGQTRSGLKFNQERCVFLSSSSICLIFRLEAVWLSG